MRKLALFIGTVLVLTGCIQPKYPHPSTWSVIAADPATGEVGIAAASCVPLSIDGLASLVPGKGVAATQAAFDISNRDRVFELLKDGTAADEIVAIVTGDDVGAQTRQYGIITFNANGDEAQISGFTGSDNSGWAGHKQGVSKFFVSAQGNILESEEVVQATLDAFQDESLGPLTLSDRLMRGLEAGSAAGGDKRCNRVSQQTAAAAFIMVSQPDEQPFAAPDFGQTSADSSNNPSLYLTVSNPVAGANPIIELRTQYDQWRSTNLPACPDCDLDKIEVPAGGGELAAAIGSILFFLPTWLIFACVGLIGTIVLLIVWFVKRRKARRNNV